MRKLGCTRGPSAAARTDLLSSAAARIDLGSCRLGNCTLGILWRCHFWKGPKNRFRHCHHLQCLWVFV